MIKGQNIVYFGPGKWEGMWRNRHHLMSRFARCNKVMYVEPEIGLRVLGRQLFQRNKRQSEFWKKAGRRLVTMAAKNLYIYHSSNFIPVSGRFPLNKISWWAFKSLLKVTMVRLGFYRPIIWLSMPNRARFIGGFNEKLSIYHVVDEYLGYGDMDFEGEKKLEIMEQQMIKMTDLVIVVSERLLVSKGAFNKYTFRVPNGVDYASYDRAILSDVSIPDDIARLPRPILGYSGLISRRLDLDLLQHIAGKNPEWSIAFIGTTNEHGCKNDLSRLRQMNNVYFLGQKEIQQVPHYVKAFDVCLIPYKICLQTENLDSLKLYDFMAAGKPIITTDFAGVSEFKDLVYISDSKDKFTDCVKKALRETGHTLFDQRRRMALQNTWENRVEEISQLIEKHLANRKNGKVL